ncbi:family 2 glycosyl transferase [Rathayibacter tritici]|uniref:glycosyltransferase family 2 protein n=1 Tax=Rathayibacter tritici TaxID=33888 RepID=UPI000CE84901|nr:glycosyltransferase family 2 protein [Rathayibacter tritici]PPF68976.1 family 2 glycosyl transferase [Rathayibacter tritici]PPG07693.1 family 2 glycosyl transferase [Rathayibacter tritici]
MKIFAAMTVKDEADIVEDVIRAALSWADLVLVMDNGSTDGTWEVLERLAASEERIVLWGRFLGRFRDSLRQQIFADFRHLSAPGDWWCRLDADEFYLDDPRQFLESLPSRVDHVFSASFQFFLTEEDLARERESGPDHSAMSWYLCNHSEIRFVQHRPRTLWPQHTVWPLGLAHPATTRIRLRHYQYRTAQQVQGRLAVRAASGPDAVLFGHEKGSAEQWYRRRGLTPPADPALQAARVVLTSELQNSPVFDPTAAYPDPPRRRSPQRALAESVISAAEAVSAPFLRRLGD